MQEKLLNFNEMSKEVPLTGQDRSSWTLEVNHQKDQKDRPKHHHKWTLTIQIITNNTGPVSESTPFTECGLIFFITFFYLLPMNLLPLPTCCTHVHSMLILEQLESTIGERSTDSTRPALPQFNGIIIADKQCAFHHFYTVFATSSKPIVSH